MDLDMIFTWYDQNLTDFFRRLLALELAKHPNGQSLTGEVCVKFHFIPLLHIELSIKKTVYTNTWETAANSVIWGYITD